VLCAGETLDRFAHKHHPCTAGLQDGIASTSNSPAFNLHFTRYSDCLNLKSRLADLKDFRFYLGNPGRSPNFEAQEVCVILKLRTDTRKRLVLFSRQTVAALVAFSLW
jgi:hypothetical protein